ncbi:MAG: hypothetical protein K1X44_01760 [Alphaproteobacteria bacterium]|nr:hypothetical protein [Alphaproteobacteria bacterium]
MVCNTEEFFIRTLHGLRPIQPTDQKSLGVLHYHAYYGTVDDDGETCEEAITEAEHTLIGQYGAQYLIRHSLHQLYLQDYEALNLFVTNTNLPAVNLYHKLGFKEKLISFNP